MTVPSKQLNRNGTCMIDINLITESLPLLLQGLMLTLQLALAGCVIGLLLGTIVALIEVYVPKPWSYIATIYVMIIRGTPMLIQILGAYYVLPTIGITIAAQYVAIIAIGLNSAAYISQIIRSGIQSIHSGQVEAAYVLGFSRMQIIRYIVLPQAFALVIPAMGNELITLVKDSSLASIIGVSELSKQGRLIISRTYDAITIFFILAILYLAITTTISLLINYLEKRVKQPC